MSKDKLLFGTKEWAPHNFNFMNGCSNDCVYCYAKDMAIRFKRKTSDSWSDEQPVSLVGKSFGKKVGAIMIPSSHDITPGNIEVAIQVMDKLVANGNELLLVTKPHFECVKRIVDLFMENKDQIKFRFTVGSANSEVLKLWEPWAPNFEERLESLKYAVKAGYSTSISCEPLLDDQFDVLYEKVSPWVNGSIWIGKMNMASKRVKTNTAGAFPQEKVSDLLKTQTDDIIITLFNRYKDNPMIEWKESIKKVAISHALM
ncbi:MAG: radical SAM protein [Peptostreptococcaceae bacterium]|nr:radical SAM protein [Peptostreptococcaceae bacterium]